MQSAPETGPRERQAPIEWVAPEVRSRADALGARFGSAHPFPHLVLEDFLRPELLRRLQAEFPPFDPERARNEYGEVGGKAVHEALGELGPAYAELDRLLRDPAFLALLSRLTGIPDLLHDPEYLGGGTHENRHGQELDMHVDFNYHPSARWHRRLNLILFLNDTWASAWGGALDLQRDPWAPEDPVAVRIAPLANRCVIFETSERSWHGFERIELPEGLRDRVSRRSVAVYYYTRLRPRSETSPEHATVYVPRPLPEHLVPGHVLDEGDLAAVRDLLTRRDTQMRFLYEREKEFSAAIERLRRSREYRLGVRLIGWRRQLRRRLRRWLGRR